jgi:hypothetical protein
MLTPRENKLQKLVKTQKTLALGQSTIAKANIQQLTKNSLSSNVVEHDLSPIFAKRKVSKRMLCKRFHSKMGLSSKDLPWLSCVCVHLTAMNKKDL